MQAQQQTDTLRLPSERATFGTSGALLLMVGLLLLFMGSPLPSLLLFILPALMLFLWAARAVVVAGAEGLRWRFLGRWHAAAWEEIDDYFLCLNQSEGRPASWIRFRDGRVLRLSESNWGEQSAFRAQVAEKASNAKPSGWLLRGKEGTITGRHVFRYKKRAEYFEADAHGIVYFDGHAQQEAAWSEVLSLHTSDDIFRRSQSTLETPEWSASFSAALRGNALLCAMVRQYAPHASRARLRTPRQELLVSTERNDGTRIFHYQTRSNRNALTFWLGTALVLISAALGMTLLLGLSRAVLEPLFYGTLCLLYWGFGFWHYKVERIVVDRESVTQYKRFRTTRLFFEEIKELAHSPYSDALVTQTGERPISWSHSLANVAELRQEIEKHLSR